MPGVKGQPRDSRPTLKQRRAVDNLLENGGNVSKAMRDAGYSPATAKNPNKLTEGKGFQQVYEECGLTPGLITRSLVEDIQKKPQKRSSELSLGADVLGMKQKGSAVVVQNNTQINFDRDAYT